MDVLALELSSSRARESGDDLNPDAGEDAGPPCFLDADGDGWAVDTPHPCSAGGVTRRGDCYDDNPDVFPGQNRQFVADRGDGSFDYNCDGVEELFDDGFGHCPAPETTPPREGVGGWLRTCVDDTGGEGCIEWSTVPACGRSALHISRSQARNYGCRSFYYQQSCR